MATDPYQYDWTILYPLADADRVWAGISMAEDLPAAMVITHGRGVLKNIKIPYVLDYELQPQSLDPTQENKVLVEQQVQMRKTMAFSFPYHFPMQGDPPALINFREMEQAGATRGSAFASSILPTGDQRVVVQIKKTEPVDVAQPSPSGSAGSSESTTTMVSVASQQGVAVEEKPSTEFGVVEEIVEAETMVSAPQSPLAASESSPSSQESGERPLHIVDTAASQVVGATPQP